MSAKAFQTRTNGSALIRSPIQIALIVSCLASFRQLFVKAEQSGRIKPTDGLLARTHTGLVSTFRSQPSKISSSSTPSGSFFNRTQYHQTVQSFDSGQPIVPLDDIYVRHEVELMRDPIHGGTHIPISVVGSCSSAGGHRR